MQACLRFLAAFASHNSSEVHSSYHNKPHPMGVNYLFSLNVVSLFLEKGNQTAVAVMGMEYCLHILLVG